MSTPLTIAGLRCVVIGAASGVGEAVASRLRARGARVVTADLSERELVDHAVDVSDPESVHHLVRDATDALGGIDAVVSTAGVLGRVQPSRDETLEEFERIVRVNLTGAFIVSTAVLPAMAEAGFGRLVLLASTAGRDGAACMAGYSAAKAGVMGLVKSLAREYAAFGVTVNAVAPGKLDTPMVRHQPPTADDLARIPMGRLGTADEAAALIEWLISPEASYTTGVTHDLSGGRSMP